MSQTFLLWVTGVLGISIAYLLHRLFVSDLTAGAGGWATLVAYVSLVLVVPFSLAAALAFLAHGKLPEEIIDSVATICQLIIPAAVWLGGLCLAGGFIGELVQSGTGPMTALVLGFIGLAVCLFYCAGALSETIELRRGLISRAAEEAPGEGRVALRGGRVVRIGPASDNPAVQNGARHTAVDENLVATQRKREANNRPNVGGEPGKLRRTESDALAEFHSILESTAPPEDVKRRRATIEQLLERKQFGDAAALTALITRDHDSLLDRLTVLQQGWQVEFPALKIDGMSGVEYLQNWIRSTKRTLLADLWIIPTMLRMQLTHDRAKLISLFAEAPIRGYFLDASRPRPELFSTAEPKQRLDFHMNWICVPHFPHISFSVWTNFGGSSRAVVESRQRSPRAALCTRPLRALWL